MDQADQVHRERLSAIGLPQPGTDQLAVERVGSNDLAAAALSALITAAPILVAFVFSQRYLVSGYLAGAEKG